MMTHSSVYPNCAPPARSVAQLPGSHVTDGHQKTGPENASNLRQNEAFAGTKTLR